jgi:uncharacterized protein YdiU (UPF0061 family)
MPTSHSSTTDDIGWRFDNSYARLPDAFHTPATPAEFREPRLAVFNRRLAEDLGLNHAAADEHSLAELFTGQTIPNGAQPLAQAYAGHQFGGFTMLGDGRAILLGEHVAPAGRRVDVQFKGPGPTRYSRRGDGLAALGPMLREYIISEAMHGLGIPTTRSLAVVTTGESVYRDPVQRGAVLTRVAASHLRVGTFQYAAARGEPDLLRALADYAIARHDADLVDRPDRYRLFLDAVIARQAALIARWQLVGFVHGVMNTDNMTISGETIDYGPCAFLDTYHPEMVFSSIDHAGRYAFGRQPGIGLWNLTRFAETLLPLLDDDEQTAVAIATESLEQYAGLFEAAWLDRFRRKLGLTTVEPGDGDLAEALFVWMAEHAADFTETFRILMGLVGETPRPSSGSESRTPESAVAECTIDREWHDWLRLWRARLSREGRPTAEIEATMSAANPAVIPRNHRVEEALAAACDRDDYAPLKRLVDALADPYRIPAAVKLTDKPPAGCGPYRTFCGT